MAKKKSDEIGCLGVLFRVCILMPLLAIALLGVLLVIIFLMAFFAAAFAAAYETSKAVLILICSIVVLLCVAIYKLVKSIRQKRKKNNKSEKAEQQAKISVDTSDPASVIISVPSVEPFPKDGKYPADHLAKLKAEQEARREQNSHYKIAVIDFETTGLNPALDEILQVSIIDEKENVLINQYCKAQKWPSWDDASRINGIWPTDVAFCPTFKEVAPYVQDILSRADTVIAYNYPFEPNFLRENKIDPDIFKWGIDPMKLAAKYYNKEFHSTRSKMKLSAAAEMIGYQYNPHDALEDVKATLHVYKFLTFVNENSEKANFSQKPKEKRVSVERSSSKRYQQNIDADVNHPLYDKTIVFTGDLSIDREEAAERASALGAKVRTGVSEKTDILVCGERPDDLSSEFGSLSAKYKKALELNDSGKADIEFMDEDEFMELLNYPAGQI
nr:MAG TPA: DEDDh [Caudoviricetes sp.]